MEWPVPFTAATIAYLLGSALVVGSRYPVRWIVGIIAATWVVPTLIAMFHAWTVEDVSGMMWYGWGGVSTVFWTRWDVDRLVNQRVGFWQWGVSTSIWMVAAGLATWVAARRRLEV